MVYFAVSMPCCVGVDFGDDRYASTGGWMESLIKRFCYFSFDWIPNAGGSAIQSDPLHWICPIVLNLTQDNIFSILPVYRPIRESFAVIR